MAAGFVALTVGGDRLVSGAVGLARRFGISSLVIGLTVVAFGTSAPELFVSLQAGLRGTGDIAMGNIIGSNIFNLSVILGAAALMQPINVKSQLIRQDIPFMIAATLLFYFITRDVNLTRLEGGLLFLILIGYITVTVIMARKAPEPDLTREVEHHLPPRAAGGLFVDVVWVAAGIGLLALGASWLVDGAVAIARALEVSEALIGLTLVAAGTSLPELATTVVAALKKESDIAVGNVVGSNIFNLLCIGGLAPLFNPLSFPDMQTADFLVMIALTLIMLPLSISRMRIGRIEGLLLLSAYGAYLYFIWPY
ncbi:MAG: calcium/sodium antiporter [Kiritimatiellia bacterium]